MSLQTNRNNRRAMGLTVAASTAFAALGVAPATVHAQSAPDASNAAGAYVTVLTPFPGSSFEGSKQIEVSAFYQDASAGGGISSVEITIDGQSAAVKRLDRPELRGVVSFLIDPSTLDSGSHQVVIRVTSVSGDTSKVRTSFKYNGSSGIVTQRDPNVGGISSAAGVSVLSPQPTDHVSGTVTIKVQAVDPSGKAPYVSLFIDKVFKTLRNYPPYSFDWDTTRIANGWHTIEVSAFNDDNQLGKTDPVRVYVNNGGGETVIDRTLTDTVPAAPTKAALAPAAAPSPVKSAVAPTPVAAPVAEPTVGPATLAKPALVAPAISQSSPEQLASAAVASGTISTQTLLDAPFLTKQAPPAPEEVTPSTPANFAHAKYVAPTATIHDSQKLASAAISGGDISAEVTLSAPFLNHQAEPVVARPMPPAEFARAASVQVKASLPDAKIASANVDTTASYAASMEAPGVDRLPETPKPLAPAALAHGNRPDVTVKLPTQQIASANMEAIASPETLASAPFLLPQPATVVAKPIAPKAAVVVAPTPVVAPVAPVVAAVAPIAPKAVKVTKAMKAAELAKAAAETPSVSLGAQLLASAGYTPSAVPADVLLSAPFLTRKAAPAPEISSASAELAAMRASLPQVNLAAPALKSGAMSAQALVTDTSLSAPDAHAIAAPVLPKAIVAAKPLAAPSLATERPKVSVTTAESFKMASAGVSVSPEGNGVLEAPHVGAVHIDTTNVPHAAVYVARPQTGVFSSEVRHKVSGQFEVVMNDHPLSLERPIQDHANVLCAPIRRIFESQGGILQWSPKTHSVRALSPTRDVQLQIGSTNAKVNNQDQKLSTAPYINGGRTMIPIGFLPTAMDVTVTYDAASGHLVINSKD